MALARVQYQQTVSGTTNFTVPFPYISKDHVKASVDGTDVTFTWVNNNTIKLSTAPAVGAIIDIRRETERVNLLVDFQDASTITEQQLDLAAQQTFYIAQEAFDATGGTMAVANDGSYSANGRRLSLVGYPDSDDDAANVQYVKDVLVSGHDAHQERLLAEAARNKAQQWAENGENVAVETGKYSAKHHAIKSAASATNSANSATNSANSATSAANSANTATTKASEAASSASSAASSASTATNEANRSKTEADRSKTEADRAMGYASSLNMPSMAGSALKMLRAKADETGYEFIPSFFSYGLGGQCKFINGSDLNLLTATGFYMGANLINAPENRANWFYVIHLTHNDLYNHQIAIDLDNNERVFTRSERVGYWRAWKEIPRATPTGRSLSVAAPVSSDPGASSLPYTSAWEVRESGYLANTVAAAEWVRPAISFHWGGRYVRRLSLREDGELMWDNDQVMRASHFPTSLGYNGYIKFPSGLIIQWGRTGSVDGDSYTDVTMPIAFPSIFIGAHATPHVGGAAAKADNWGMVEPLTTSSLRVYRGLNGASQTNIVYWMALGY